MTEIVALVPMRHQSFRVPEKNYRMLAGKPLYYYIIQTLISCSEISKVVVDTDSPIIKVGLLKHYPAVKVIDRPEHLRADTIPMNEILMFDCEQVKADLYLQTHSTNPLLKSATISKAIEFLESNKDHYDSLFSVTKIQARLWDAKGNPLNHDPKILLRTQDLPPVYEENSCLYLFNSKTLVERRNRLGYKPLMYEIDPDEAWDIDEQLDFDIVEDLILRRQNNQN